MIAQTRQVAILKYLAAHPRVDVSVLQRGLRLSRSTMRRELVELEHLGKVVRVHGAVALPGHMDAEPSFNLRHARQVEEKKQIARCAVQLVEPGSSVYLDAGTTCLEVARLLMPRRDLRLFTHSIKIAVESYGGAASMTCVGGEVRPVSEALVGGLTEHWLGNLSFDVAFVAASGVCEEGPSTTETSEAVVKQNLLRRSATTILVADSEKWDHPSTVRFADWSMIDAWVADEALSKRAAGAVARQGASIVIAKKSLTAKTSILTLKKRTPR